MTVKQRSFIKKYVESRGNGTQAALDVYDTTDPNVAHAIASENLQKPTIKREIELALERTGLTGDYISELLKEATVAGLGVKATNSDALRGIEIMLKLKNAFPDKKSAHLRIDLKEKVQSMSYIDAKAELQECVERTQKLLNDLNS